MESVLDNFRNGSFENQILFSVIIKLIKLDSKAVIMAIYDDVSAPEKYGFKNSLVEV